MPDLTTPQIMIILAFACAGVFVIGAFIWIFILGRSFSAIVMMIVGIVLNGRETFDEDAPIEISDEHRTERIRPQRAQEIPFDAQVPNIKAKESLASSGMQPEPTSDNMTQAVPNAPSFVDVEDEVSSADPRGFRHRHLRPNDSPPTNQE